MKKYLTKISKGNCIDIMKDIPKDKINLVLTDPPYNASKRGVNLPNNKTGGAYYKIKEKWDMFKNDKEYSEFTKNWIKEADKLLKKTGSMIIFSSMHNIGEILITLKMLHYKILNIITWEKTNAMPNITKRMLKHSSEYIIWASKGKGWKFNYLRMKKYNSGKQLGDVWKFPLCQGKERIKNITGRALHPTQKPEKIVERLIEMATDKHDIILDPFMGTGTTAVSANRLDRKWIGIELKEKYIKVANKRIKNSSFKKKIYSYIN